MDITITSGLKSSGADDGNVEEQDLGAWLQAVAQKYNKQPARARQWLKTCALRPLVCD